MSSENQEKCRICGCTFNNPCIDEIHGVCWWMDLDHTICSHCFWKLDMDGAEDESLL